MSSKELAIPDQLPARPGAPAGAIAVVPLSNNSVRILKLQS